MLRTLSLISLATAAFALSAAAQVVILDNDFNSVDVRDGFGSNAYNGQIGEAFVVGGSDANALLGNASTNRDNIRVGDIAGVDGSRAMSGSNVEGAVRSRSQIDITTTTSFSFDFFMGSAPSGSGTRAAVAAGFALPAGADTTGVTGGRNDRTMIGISEDSTDRGNFFFSGIGRANDSAGQALPGTPTFALTTGEWYSLSFGLTFDGLDTYTVDQLELVGTGTSGTDAPVLVGEITGQFDFNPGSGGNLDGQTQAFAFVMLSNRGATAVDNVYVEQGGVIPEPSTYAGIAGLVAVAIVYLRRRR